MAPLIDFSNPTLHKKALKFERIHEVLLRFDMFRMEVIFNLEGVYYIPIYTLSQHEFLQHAVQIYLILKYANTILSMPSPAHTTIWTKVALLKNINYYQ